MCNRDVILTDLVRDWPTPLDATMRSLLQAVLNNFGCAQLQAMQAAGVRLWPERYAVPAPYAPYVGFAGRARPPGLVVQYDSHGSPAAYLPAIRTIAFEPGLADAYGLTHELAHAWDDLGNESRASLSRLDALTGGSLQRALRRLAQQQAQSRTFRSSTMRRRAGIRTLPQVFQDYMVARRQVRSDVAHFGLAGGGTEEQRNVAEFYAEGYAVFHGGLGLTSNQARLLVLAPDLYGFLADETSQYQIPSFPDPQAVERERQAFLRMTGLRH